MGTSLQEKIASLPPERKARIKAETAHLQATYMTLKDLRRAHDMTQVHLAKQPGQKLGDGKTYGLAAFDRLYIRNTRARICSNRADVFFRPAVDGSLAISNRTKSMRDCVGG